jgi:hypothetical protein
MAAPSNDSRYYDSVVDYFTTTPDGENAPVMLYDFSELGTINYVDYLWKNGDRIDSLAAQYFLFPTRWWIIAEFNPTISDWLNVAPGTIVRIPRV